MLGAIIGPNFVIGKDVKKLYLLLLCQTLKLIVCVRGTPWSHTGATQYHAQLGLPDKVRAIKGLVCYVEWQVSMKVIGTSAKCWSGP